VVCFYQQHATVQLVSKPFHCWLNNWGWVDAPCTIAMSKEDQRKRSGRTSYFDSYNSPWHFPRTIWSGDSKILAVSKPVVDKDPKGFELTAHAHLRTPRPNWQIETAASAN
jgi:hypothetical protein